MSPAARRAAFRADVLAGLARRPRRIPCKWLYDPFGSALFERICALGSYPLTRAEQGLLERHGADIAARVGPGRVVVDLGAGSMRKTRALLAALDSPRACVPVDIAPACLAQGARRLAAAFPGLPVTPVVADFTRRLPPPPLAGPRLVFFPGSTIGNLRRTGALRLLTRLVALAGEDGLVLVGVDMPKPRSVLESAYADAEGVTAAFTLNLLSRIRRELGGGPDPAAFRHRARWNAAAGRVELHLVCRRRHVSSLAGRRLAFRRGEAVHVEDCHKYDVPAFHRLARRAGLRPSAVWVDAADGYALHLMEPAEPA